MDNQPRQNARYPHEVETQPYRHPLAIEWRWIVRGIIFLALLVLLMKCVF